MINQCLTLSKIEYSINDIHRKIVHQGMKDCYALCPNLIERLENVLDRCLNRSLGPLNVSDAGKILSWIRWSIQTRQGSEIKRIVPKAYKVVSSLLDRCTSLYREKILSELGKEVLQIGLPRNSYLSETFTMLIGGETITSEMILHFVSKARLDILRFLHYAGVDIDVKDEKGESSLLYRVIIERQVAILKFLIAEGFPINQKWENPHTSYKDHHPFFDPLFVDDMYNPDSSQIAELLFPLLLPEKIDEESDVVTKYLSSITPRSMSKSLWFLDYLTEYYEGRIDFLSIYQHMIIPTFLENDPKSVEFINVLQKNAQQHNRKANFIDALETHFNVEFKESSEKAMAAFKRYVDPEYPYYVEVIDRIRMYLSQKIDVSLLKRFDEEFPPEKWDLLPRGSAGGQKRHWYPGFKTRAAQRGIKCPVPKVRDELDLKIGKEIFLRILISNISNNNEECLYPICDKYEYRQKLSYEGFLGNHGYFYRILKKAYLETTTNPDKEITNFLDRSTNATLKEQLQFIEEGKEFSITFGYAGHTIQIMIMDGMLVVCDTGIIAKKHSFEIYRINKNKLTLEWLEKLKNNLKIDSSEGFILLIDELIEGLEGQRHGLSDFSKGEDFFLCLQQIMGNCPWMSKEAAFYFYLFLKNFKGIVTEEEWQTGLKVSEETLKELSLRMTKTDEEFTKMLSKALLRFLNKEMEGIRNGTWPLKPHWKFLLDVLVRPLRYNIPQEDAKIYTGYLAEIFKLCPLGEVCSLIKGLKSRYHEFGLYPSLLAALDLVLQSEVSQEKENIQEVIFKYRQLVAAVLECCPPDYVSLKGAMGLSALGFAILLEDEALEKSLLESVFIPSKEALTLSYNLGYKKFTLKFLQRQIMFIEKRDMLNQAFEQEVRSVQKVLGVKILPPSKMLQIENMPEWKLFLQVLLDPLVEVPGQNVIFLLSDMFALCSEEELCSLVQEVIKPRILENENLYDLLIDALDVFLKSRQPKKEQPEQFDEQSLIEFRKAVIQYRQLVTNILECSPLSSEGNNGVSLIWALFLGDEVLAQRFLEKLQSVENLIENVLRFAQMLGDEKMMLWLKNHKK